MCHFSPSPHHGRLPTIGWREKGSYKKKKYAQKN